MKLLAAIFIGFSLISFLAIKLEEKYFPPNPHGYSFFAYVDVIDIRPVEDIVREMSPPQPEGPKIS